jgi:Tfp pilus assembly protein PilX
VVAVIMLLALSALGVALMASVQIEDKIVGYQRRDTQALYVAEAGIQEALHRIRSGDVPDDGNKRRVTLIYEAPAGSLPVSGPDTTSLPTLQPSGQYLGYSSANKRYIKGSTTDLQALTVKYKTKITPGSPPDTQIVRYDEAATPKMNTTTGTPVFVVTASTTRNNVTRSVVAEVTRAKFNLLTQAAVAAKVGIAFKGNAKVCGHNHLASTPAGTEPPGCNLGIGTWWAPGAHADCLPGGWSESTITEQGSPDVIGEPTDVAPNQSGFYGGPWDALGLSQPEFWAWIGYPTSSPPSPPQGIVHLDSNSIPQDQSGDYSYNGGNGEGLLYVDGDLHINGNFNYRGLIYIEGDLKLNGNAWILGGLIVRGTTTVNVANGSAVVLYSADAIQQNISKHGGRLRTLAWREF